MSLHRTDVAVRRRAAGFTLNELLVTLSVLAIVATAALPSFTQFIANQRVRNAASDLASAFTLMRSEAVKRNTSTTLAADGSTWSSGWVVSAGTERLRGYGPYTGITISTAGGNTLWVGNDGRPGNGSQTFQVAMTDSTSNAVCVQISGTGRVAAVAGACS